MQKSIYGKQLMAKMQNIRRKNGSLTNFMYFPKKELREANFKQDEDLLVEAKKGCIIIRNSVNEPDSENNNPTDSIEQMQIILSLDPSEVEEAVRKFGNPVELQKKLAVQIKNFLDSQIKRELDEKGYLSDSTRRWVESYNNILEKIQKAMYGEKNTNLHVQVISHGEIAAKMRESVKRHNT